MIPSYTVSLSTQTLLYVKMKRAHCLNNFCTVQVALRKITVCVCTLLSLRAKIFRDLALIVSVFKDVTFADIYIYIYIYIYICYCMKTPMAAGGFLFC